MKIIEAMLELDRIREHIMYLENKLPLGFKIKEIDSELGDKFIKDILMLIDNAYKKHNKAKSQVVKALIEENYDKDGSLMDALINLTSLKKRRDVFDEAMTRFVEAGDSERIKKTIEQFQSTITVINKIEKSLINKLSSLEVLK
jgi:hypothetical protein